MTSSVLSTIPDSPAELGLPFAELRPYQREAVAEAMEGFERCSVVQLEAPTGSGKTIIGAALGKLLGGRALFLAHTKDLQNQQLRTLPDAVTATGRSNHTCDKVVDLIDGKPMTASDAPCICEFARDGGCSYYQQWFDADRADSAVLNYAYAVRVLAAERIHTATGNMDNPFQGRNLMVCDEAHAIERALLDACANDLPTNSLRRLGLTPPSVLRPDVYIEWISQEAVPVTNRALLEAAEDLAETRASGLIKPSALIDQGKRVRGLERLVESLKSAAASLRYGDTVVVQRPAGPRTQPLWVHNAATPRLFRHAPNVLLMSATLGDPETMSWLLGFDNYAHVRVPSTFPIANRPVLYWPVAKMRYNMPDEEKARQAVALITLARKFPNTPGVVHTNSFKLATYLMDAVGQYAPDVRARMVSHNGTNRSRVFAAFEDDPGNAILLTPSATTGVDWDFVGWQMIPKVPYPDLSDELTLMRYNYVTDEGFDIGKRVYQQEAITALVQASGRCVRTPVSKGVTVITDSAFWPLFKYIAPAAFPDWFRDAVRWWKPTEGQAA